jgi:hypothetical protein
VTAFFLSINFFLTWNEEIAREYCVRNNSEPKILPFLLFFYEIFTLSTSAHGPAKGVKCVNRVIFGRNVIYKITGSSVDISAVRFA